MKKRIGNGFLLCGFMLLAGALILFLYNQQEAETAKQASIEVITQLIESIEEVDSPIIPMEHEANLNIPIEYLDDSAFEMTEVEINGHMYIGYLSLPTLNLELPIMSNWDYQKLKISPCRYTGSVMGRNLVLMAHNYAAHFGKISELIEGDRVIFVDMNGNATFYEVVAQDILAPSAVEEMTAGAYDLTLFTCTYGGANRVTVYCNITHDAGQ